MKQKKMLQKLFLLVFCFIGMLNPFGLIASDEDITVSAVGDCIITNKVSHFKHPQFLKMVDILRKADVTYGNCETTFFKPEEGFPAYKDFDPNVFCYPWGADEMKWFGIDLMSLANNHIMDFDYDGMFATIKNLDRVGIEYAGAGKDLEHASRHGVFETAKGPVALISCSSWLPEKNHQASLPSAYMKGKPGLNPINVDFVLQVDERTFSKMKEVHDEVMKGLGLPLDKDDGKEVKELKMAENRYKKGDKIELILKAKKRDLERIKASIKVAKRSSRLVIVSLHEHVGRWTEKAPTQYQEDFARSCIDAGADIFVGTGSHELWGIEIYKGKPIFYSVGNFLFHMPLRMIAPEAYERIKLPMDTKDPTLYEEKFTKLFSEMSIPIFESVIPFMTFDKNNKVKEILLYPIYLNEKVDWYRKGTPELADAKTAKVIMDRLQKISKRYKTKFRFEKGVGRIVL
jgi:poly-gamma-glutamate capsule biosynthesis protein CapA/YwtB (metallophosphatase superfamily)